MRTLCFLSFFLLFLASNAPAQEGVYIAAKAGASFMSFDDGQWFSQASGNITNSYHRDEDNTVFAVGAAVGYAFEWPVRAELEYMFRTNFEYTQKPTRNGVYNVTQDLNSHTLLMNLFYDFENNTAFTPYIMAGGGIAIHRSDNSVSRRLPGLDYQGEKETKTNFAWNIGGGVAYDLTKSITLDLTARYVDMGEARWKNEDPGNDKGTAKADMRATECLLGVRYNF